MDTALKNLLFQLGLEEKSILQEYLERVANKGLTRYKRIIQTGKKEGESLYTHVLNGIFVLERLHPPLGLSDTEAKLLMTVYSVHDINKVEGFSGKSYKQIGIKANFDEEAQQVGVAEFFPEYRDYLEDITALACAHSGHYHSDGQLLIKSHDPYKIGRERIEALKFIIRAIDIIDLSSTLEERVKKNDFLSQLNTYCSKHNPVKQYEFQTHQVTENRGILTNIIHNQIAAYLEKQFGFLPLLFYPDGVAYLVEKGRTIEFGEEHFPAIGQAVQMAINKMTKAKFSSDFISGTQQGIKVDAKYKEIGLGFEEIFTEVYNMIAGRTFLKRLDDMAEKAKNRALTNAKNKTEKLNDEKERNTLLELAAQIENTEELMPRSDEKMRIGELVRSYYIFLNAHYKKAVPNAWDYLYKLLQIPEERRAFYDLFDSLYDRPYVLAKDINYSFDDIHSQILAAGSKLFEEMSRNTQSALLETQGTIAQYVRQVLNFSFAPPQQAQFLKNLQTYLRNTHEQCCYCGSAFETKKWMSADVPGDVKVQYFSNRLEGGQREPKRSICQICNTQFILYKLNYPALSPGNLKKQGVNTYYLHLLPYSFYADSFLKSLQACVNRLKRLNVEALYLLTDEAIRQFLKEHDLEPRYNGVKSNGFPLPKFSDVLGNTLLFPLNCMGENESDRFLFAIENALIMQKYFGCKVVLTDSSVGIVEKTEFDDLYIDSIPISFRGLLPTNNLDSAELERVWKRLGILHQLKDRLFSDGGELLELIRTLSESAFSLYYACERLMLKKLSKAKKGASPEWQEILLSQDVSLLINQLLEGGEPMEQLKTLARIAWEGKLKGETLKKHSLMMPFDLAFDKLHQKSEHVDLKTLQAALTEDIFAYLERIASEEFKPGAGKREKIKAFIEGFFGGLLQEVYHNNINKLLADEKILKSAFLCYVRDQIPSKKSEE